MMGSPFTRTTKLPRPGFSGFTTTDALFPTALTIALARVLNTDHCLQASIVTVAPPLTVATSAEAFFATAAAGAFFEMAATCTVEGFFTEDSVFVLAFVLDAATGTSLT